MAGVNNTADVKEMCGIICVNKPVDFTSFDVIAKLRGILRIKRLGHAGTLDPMATGVLPVFVGRATKACDILSDHDKIYKAGFMLGVTTDTQDSTGIVTKERDPSAVNTDKLSEILEKFRGNIMQIPPMYSAVSVNGKRLYDLARQGIEIEREARPITIYKLELSDYSESSHSGIFTVSCSKGTYIRTLINDIGEALGCGGIMTSLVRTKACGFSLDDCVTIEDLQRESEGDKLFEQYLKPVDEIFADLPKLKLFGAQERMYRNGIKLDLNRIKTDISAKRIAVYGEYGFIGTAVPDIESGVLRIEKNFLNSQN